MNDELLTMLLTRIEKAESRLALLERVPRLSGVTTSHSHSKLVASDGAPDPAFSADATGKVTAANDLAVTSVLTARSLIIPSAGTVTIADGVLTVTGSLHRVEGEGGASDNLDTVSGTVDGQIVILRRATSGHVITVRDDGTGGGNLSLGASTRVLTQAYDVIVLQNFGGQLAELSYVDNL